MSDVLHLRGPILAGPDDVRAQAWVVDGIITYAPPAGRHDVTSVGGWVLPGYVDAHCHVGLGPQGAVSDAEAETQALMQQMAVVFSEASQRFAQLAQQKRDLE